MLFYSLTLKLYRLAIGIASWFNPKAKSWITGRKSWAKNLKAAVSELSAQPIWMHVSSVGEYEQGRPILEELKSRYPDVPVVLTFFSPSGYDLLKENTQADHVAYLPLDGAANSKRFLEILNPRAAIFIKYEFWYYYFKRLRQQEIPFALISAKLRPDQFFFSWYGKSYQKVLRMPNYYFVQDQVTADLLAKIGVDQVSIAGDTRVDRVADILTEQVEDAIVQSHIGNKKTLILGSAWKAELDLMVKVLNAGKLKDWKIIIAPHEIDPKKIDALEERLDLLSLRYTLQVEGKVSEDVPVLIVDCVGRLKHLYKYCDIAFVGGGFVDGIHNILEPAAFGLSVIFGPNYQKFPEAQTLIDQGGAYSIHDDFTFWETLKTLSESEEKRAKAAEVNKAFVLNNVGATDDIMKQLGRVLHVD